MKSEKTKNGIKLIPENSFEEELLEWISNKQLTATFEDAWNKTGPLNLEFKSHPWDT